MPLPPEGTIRPLEPPSPSQQARERRTRALEEPLDVRTRPGTPYLRLEVRNSRHQTRYWVLVPSYPSRDGALCNCTDFARRGLSTCKHLEAAWLWLSENPSEGTIEPSPFDGRPFWTEVDRCQSAVSRDRTAAALRYRRTGERLFESEGSRGPA